MNVNSMTVGKIRIVSKTRLKYKRFKHALILNFKENVYVYTVSTVKAYSVRRSAIFLNSVSKQNSFWIFPQIIMCKKLSELT